MTTPPPEPVFPDRPESARATTARPAELDALPCVFCGYDLRHLDVEGLCPECGRPIVRSLRGSEIAASDPRWVARLCGGVSAFLIALPVIWFPLAWPVAWWGAWRMASPDPRHGQTTKMLLLRWVLLALIPGIPVMLMATADRVPGIMPLAVVGAAVALLMCGESAASRLVRRAANPGLQRFMRIAGWPGGIGFAISLAYYALDAFRSLSSGRSLPVPLGSYLIPVGIGAYISWLFLPGVLIWLWKVLDSAQFQATADTQVLAAAFRRDRTPPAGAPST